MISDKESTFLNKKLQETFSSVLGDVALKKSSRNKEFYRFLAFELLKKANIIDDKLVEKITNYSTSRDSWKLNKNFVIGLLQLEAYNLSASESGMLYRIVVSLLSAFKKNNLIKFPQEFNLLSAFTDRPLGLLTEFPFRNCIPLISRELFNVSTPIRFKASKDYLTLKTDGIPLINSAYKTWNKSCIDMSQFFILEGIEDFQALKEIDLNKILEFVVHRKKMSGIASYLPVMRFIDGNYNTSYVEKLNEFVESGVILRIEKRLYPNGQEKDDSKYKAINKFTVRNSPKLIKDWAGDNVSPQAVILQPKLKENEISIGKYVFKSSELGDYRAESLDENDPWIKSQLDYIESNHASSGTRKSRSQRLKYLNVYIFSYLPYFFRTEKTIFSYPKTPDQFFSHVFVKPTRVSDSLINGEKKYPLSFIDFSIRLSFLTKMKHLEGNNLARDSIATASNYFDYILNNLSGVENYKINVNPLVYRAPNIGSRYSKSIKSKFALEYWIYFRIFVKELTKAVMYEAAKQIAIAYKNEGDEYSYDIAINVAKRIKERANSKFSDIDSLVKPEKLQVNSDLKKIHEKISLKIKGIDISHFKRKIIQINNQGLKIKHLDYQSCLSVCLSAYAGLRASNGAWLDADTFDAAFDKKDFPETIDATLVPLKVYTDKVNPSGLESMVPLEIMILLQEARILRGLNHNPCYKMPIFYKSEEGGRFGKLKPLLQLSDKNCALDYNIGWLLKPYEKCLQDSNIPYKTEFMYCPTTMRRDVFEFAKKVNEVPSTIICKIKNNPEEDFLPFTPIILKTILTLHSLRKQLVSVMDVLVSDRDSISMLTGQASKTVGYYAENTPEEETEIVGKLGNAIDLIDARLSHEIKADDDFQDAVVKGELSKIYGAFTVNQQENEIGSGLLDINKTTVGELAFNWTHICPFNNDCPADVIRFVGERQCHICPKAIIFKKHACAISAKIKMLIDDIAELREKLVDDKYISIDKDEFEYQIKRKAIKASSWKIRLDYINSNGGIIAGDKDLASSKIRYIPPGSVKSNLLLRLKECEHVPSLQSDKMKRIAERISRKVLAFMSKNELLKQDSNDINLYDNPIGFAIKNLELMAELNGTTIEILLEENKDFSVNEQFQLEVFK